jgi:hypothetical protein
MTTSLDTAERSFATPRSRTSIALLWTVQGLLAAAFLAHGLMFLFPPVEIAQQMNGVLPRWFQLFLGVAEVLAAVGLTLPNLTGVAPWLAVWAACGVMIVMVSATVFHTARGELSSALVTLVLLAMAAFVARARHRARDSANGS